MTEYMVSTGYIMDTPANELYREGYENGWTDGHKAALRGIVRCRNCKHMHTVRHWLGMDVDECWLHADPECGALGKERTEPDGYCAWGERRSDD